jgi:hypothetical protein
MSHFLSKNPSFYHPLSSSSVTPPTLIANPIIPIQPIPIITPINPPAPVFPLNSFRFMG